jgi:glycosyltransferase involved in cell wall biosynthesis
VSGPGAPVKLLQFPTLFAIGGTETQVMNLAFGLDGSRFDVHFACLKRWGDFLEQIEASAKPLTEYRIDSLYGARTLRQQFRFARDLRRKGIDIVHTYGFYTNVFAIPAARLAGARVIVASIRDIGDHLTPTKRWVQRLACSLADGILVNAEAVKHRLVEEGYDPGRITVISNGIDVARVGRSERGTHLRHELGLPPRAPVVAVFSRLNPLKGIEYFLEAAASVGARFPEARFLVVGDGHVLQDGVVVDSPYKRELEAHAVRLGLEGRVVFAGFRLDVPDLLSEVAISVLPSLSEGLSNSVLESMGAGVPVVATAIGGTPEAVQDGVSGLLVPPRDARALAHAICTVLEDPELARRLGRAAQQRVSDHFSNEQMVRRTERFYLGLLANKAQRRAAAEPFKGVA